MKKTAILLTALLAGPAFGACDDARWLERPDIPDGKRASFEEMADALDAVNAYIAAGEKYLECNKPEPFVHNFIVERLERAAKSFNRERKEFMAVREAVAAN